jgi:hypothetical protein
LAKSAKGQPANHHSDNQLPHCISPTPSGRAAPTYEGRKPFLAHEIQQNAVPCGSGKHQRRRPSRLLHPKDGGDRFIY